MTYTDESYEIPTNKQIIQNVHLISLDRNIEDFYNTIIQLRSQINSINRFTNVDQCIDFLSEIPDDQVLMIVSNAS